jgi:hypothetical protein
LKILLNKELSIPKELYAKTNGNLNILSIPFEEAIERSWDKITKDIYDKVTNKCGILVRKDRATYVYDITDYRNFVFYVFQTNTAEPLFNAVGENGKYSGQSSVNFINACKRNGFETKSATGFIVDLFKILTFISYVDIETKLLAPGFRDKGVVCKYVNDTKLPVIILDSKWFTTIKTNGFPVKGHWRWQPCGEGLKDRNLIWINDFQKEGYTAPARKLSRT